MTTLLVLRLRFKLITSGKINKLMLAEEATGIAFSGTGAAAMITAPKHWRFSNGRRLAILRPRPSPVR